MAIVPIPHLLDRFRTFQPSAGEITDLSGAHQGIQLSSTTGPSHTSTVISGQATDGLPGPILVPTRWLRFVMRMLRAYRSWNGGDAPWVSVDVNGSHVEFLPLSDPFLVLSVPILGTDRTGLAIPSLDGPVIEVDVLDDHTKTLSKLIGRPSGRDVEKALTQLHIDPEWLTVVTFHGRTLSEHRIAVQATGTLQAEFPLHSFRQVLSAGILSPGKVHISQGSHLVRFQREVSLQVASLAEHIDLSPRIADLDTAVDAHRAVINRYDLHEAARQVAITPDAKLAVHLDQEQGYAEMWDATRKTVERDIYQTPLTPEAHWATGRPITSHHYHVGDAIEFIARAHDIKSALRVLADSTEIAVAWPDANPAFIVVCDVVNPFPRFMIATSYQLEGAADGLR